MTEQASKTWSSLAAKQTVSNNKCTSLVLLDPRHQNRPHHAKTCLRANAEPDQGLRCQLRTESLDILEYINGAQMPG